MAAATKELDTAGCVMLAVQVLAVRLVSNDASTLDMPEEASTTTDERVAVIIVAVLADAAFNEDICNCAIDKTALAGCVLLGVLLASNEGFALDMAEVSATRAGMIVAVEIGGLAIPAIGEDSCEFAAEKRILRRDPSTVFVDGKTELGAVTEFITVEDTASEAKLAEDTILLDETDDEIETKLDLPLGREEMDTELAIPEADFHNGTEDTTVG